MALPDKIMTGRSAERPRSSSAWASPSTSRRASVLAFSLGQEHLTGYLAYRGSERDGEAGFVGLERRARVRERRCTMPSACLSHSIDRGANCCVSKRQLCGGICR